MTEALFSWAGDGAVTQTGVAGQADAGRSEWIGEGRGEGRAEGRVEGRGEGREGRSDVGPRPSDGNGTKARLQVHYTSPRNGQ